MLKRLLKNEKGLTLIELLAVVVILGIIAAIAVPAIGKIIEDSKDKAEVSDALQIINAAKIAKAANPNQKEFDNSLLDDYLDSTIDTGVKVIFGVVDSEGAEDTWTISGHEGLKTLDDTDLNDGIATEQELVDFLDGEGADTDD